MHGMIIYLSAILFTVLYLCHIYIYAHYLFIHLFPGLSRGLSASFKIFHQCQISSYGKIFQSIILDDTWKLQNAPEHVYVCASIVWECV